MAQASSRKMRRPKASVHVLLHHRLDVGVVLARHRHRRRRCRTGEQTRACPPSPGRSAPSAAASPSECMPMRSGLSSQYQATLDRSYLITGGGLDTWGPLASRITRRL